MSDAGVHVLALRVREGFEVECGDVAEVIDAALAAVAGLVGVEDRNL
jgi:hypothetical protein